MGCRGGVSPPLMRRYIVRRVYESHVGAYRPGQVLVLDDELAGWLLRDMPGVIEELVPPEVAQPTAPDAAAAAEPEPAVRAPRKGRRRQVSG